MGKKFKKIIEYKEYEYSLLDFIIGIGFGYFLGLFLGLISYFLFRIIFRDFVDKEVHYLELNSQTKPKTK